MLQTWRKLDTNARTNVIFTLVLSIAALALSVNAWLVGATLGARADHAAELSTSCSDSVVRRSTGEFGI